MQRLSFGFVLGYHGCDQTTGESLLAGSPFKPSENDYDWLGPGIYFWEANPLRGRPTFRLPFAIPTASRVSFGCRRSTSFRHRCKSAQARLAAGGPTVCDDAVLCQTASGAGSGAKFPKKISAVRLQE